MSSDDEEIREAIAAYFRGSPDAKIIGTPEAGDRDDERQHFYICEVCGQAVDCRDLGDVFYHEQRPVHPRRSRE